MVSLVLHEAHVQLSNIMEIQSVDAWIPNSELRMCAE